MARIPLSLPRKQGLVPDVAGEHNSLHPQVLYRARKQGSIHEMTGNHNGLHPQMFTTCTKCNISETGNPA